MSEFNNNIHETFAFQSPAGKWFVLILITRTLGAYMHYAQIFFRKHKNTRALNNTPRDRVTAKLYVDNHGKKYEKNMGNEQMRLWFH